MKYTIPRVNSHLNYGLWVVMMGHCRVMAFNKYTAVVRQADSRGAVHMWGQWVHEN